MIQGRPLIDSSGTNPQYRESSEWSRLSPITKKLSRGTVIGPILVGLSKPVQVASMGAGVTELINLAALAAHEAALKESFADLRGSCLERRR